MTAEVRGDDRVIVVVDHCQELLADLREDTVNGLGAAEVVVCWNTRDRGLSGARNSGITYGSNPVVCFIDDDAVPLPGWSVAVREAFSEPEVAAVGGEGPSAVHGH